MVTWDVSRIRDLLLETGKIALSHFDAPRTAVKHDNSLVTEADQAIEEYLTERLANGSDGAVLLGEESAGGWTQERVDAALSGTTWIVDPIDGTAPYANGLPTWGISVGLMEGGRLTNGALFLPRIGEMYITSGESVLYHRGARNPVYWTFDTLTPIDPAPQHYSPQGMVSLPREVIYRGRYTAHNPIQSIGSAVYSVAKVVRGSFIGYVARINLWDVAAAVPILTRLGFPVAPLAGGTLSTAVTADHWVLDADNPRLWKGRDLLVIASDHSTVEEMRHHYHPA